MSEQATPRLEAVDVQALLDQSPFISWLRLRVVALDHEKSEIMMTMPLRPELERGLGTKQFHGGPLAAFIDTVGDFAIGIVVGGGVPTVNLRVDYLRPAIGDALTATACVRRAGKTLAVVDIDVRQEDGKLVAIGRGTYMAQLG